MLDNVAAQYLVHRQLSVIFLGSFFFGKTVIISAVLRRQSFLKEYLGG